MRYRINAGGSLERHSQRAAGFGPRAAPHDRRRAARAPGVNAAGAQRTHRRSLLPAAACVAGGLVSACQRPLTPIQTIVVYTSVDQEFAQQILRRFEQQTGVRIAAVYDTEAGKTTGLMRRLQREAEHPRCDVWWSSEVFGTIELARAGLLEPYDSPAAADIPSAWRDPQRQWTALAARARVLAYHSGRVPAEELPETWEDMTLLLKHKRVVLANPQFGTTRGHVAALFNCWGAQRSTQFLQQLREAGVQLADGNAHAVRLVEAGSADACWTDTDDVWAAQRRGVPLELIYPRIEPGGPVIWIPCSVALVRGGPSPAAARKLIDFLLSRPVEQALAESDSRNVPVREELRRGLGLAGPQPQALNFEQIADAMPAAMQAARDILLR